MAKKVVMALGVIFVVVGLLGFVNDPVLGLFEVDTVHNLVHLLSGVLALIFAAKGEDSAKMFAKVFGVVYGLVALLGLLLPGEKLLGLLEVNLADDLLHVAIAVVFLWVGFGGGHGGGMKKMEEKKMDQPAMGGQDMGGMDKGMDDNQGA